MAQLWGGRFTRQTDQLVYDFNASIRFDQRFYKQDIEGSRAHAKMLEKQGISHRRKDGRFRKGWIQFFAMWKRES